MAQLVRAPPCHGGGRGFESHPGRKTASVQSHLKRPNALIRRRLCRPMRLNFPPSAEEFVVFHISVSVYVDASHRHPALTLGCPSKHVCLDERARRATCFSGNTHYQERAGVLAQLGEHLPYKQRVIGSSPIGSIEFYYADS